MQKDINVLLQTTSPQIFEEQAKLWPGLKIFREFAWDCVCGDPDCFMNCCQGFGGEFETPDVFATYLDEIPKAGIDSWQKLTDFTKDFADQQKHKNKQLILH